jgi:glycosyltransferase involved in cell wall biosynthesis
VLTAVSRELAGKVEVLLGEDQSVHVLPNSVDGEVFVAAQEDGVRERLGVRPGELILGFCGELREKKGMSFLLTAFREIRQRREACLLVIGEVRPREQGKLTEFAVESPDAAERILVTEHLETPAEVASCLNACDIVLQPSLWDGMPNSVLEAMACGRVVLASDAGGMPEVIDHDVTGFLVPRVQLGALGVAIEEVVGLSDSRRAEIGVAAAQHVRKHFNAEVEAVALAEIVALLQAV